MRGVQLRQIAADHRQVNSVCWHMHLQRLNIEQPIASELNRTNAIMSCAHILSTKTQVNIIRLVCSNFTGKCLYSTLKTKKVN